MQEFGLTQIAKGNHSRINSSGFPRIKKINHMVNYLDKLLPVMGYVNEVLFKKKYERIA